MMATAVEEIRKQIDQLDNKIHDLLMKRADLVLNIGAQKKRSNVPVVQPGREIIMLRRLLGRHEGPLPREAVVRIWRELVGAVSLLQTGLKVAVTVPEDPHSGLAYWDMAKDYFSSVLPMQKVSSPLAALAMVREGEATFGVMPWPEDNEPNPWWGFLMGEGGEEPMRIIARLPLGDRTKDDPTAWRGLVVGRINFDDTGDDRSFIALELDRDISRGRIVDKAALLGLEALSLHSCPLNAAPRTYHLLEVDGHITSGDSRLDELLTSLDTSNDGKIVALGGYPVPPIYEDKVGKGLEAQRQQKST